MRDDKKAFEISIIAAGQGHTDAQYSVGMMLLQGRGTDKDQQAAQIWIARAAKVVTTRRRRF